MPHVTKHTPKDSTRSVKPYACESSREKRQQDRRPDRQTDGQTHRQTHRRIVQNHFSRRFGGCTSQIRSYLEVDFLHDANTSIDMEVKMGARDQLNLIKKKTQLFQTEDVHRDHAKTSCKEHK